MIKLKLEILNDYNYSKVKSFIYKFEEAMIFHTLKWKKILDAKGENNIYFLLKHHDNYVGLIPFKVFRKLNFRCMITIAPPLIERVDFFFPFADIIKKLNMADLLVVRVPLLHELSKYLTARFNKITGYYADFVLKIENKKSEEIFRSFHKKKRNIIRKAMKSNVRVEMNCIEPNEYFIIYLSKVVRKRISKRPSYDHFVSCFDILRKYLSFGDDYIILKAIRQNECIAYLIALLFKEKREAYLYDLSSLTDYLHLHPNDLLCWELIKYLVDKKFKRLRFGPSNIYSGVARFKVRFGTKVIPYCQYYIPLTSPLSSIVYRMDKLGMWANLRLKPVVYFDKYYDYLKIINVKSNILL